MNNGMLLLNCLPLFAIKQYLSSQLITYHTLPACQLFFMHILILSELFSEGVKTEVLKKTLLTIIIQTVSFLKRW